MEKILTAVIITYNHQDTIKRTITSVLKQNTNYSFEIQIWDDCSTDNTSKISAEFAEKYPDKIIHILQTKNTFYEPLNKWCFYKNYKNIKTKYFFVIEGDDYIIDNSFFQTGIDYMENNETCSIFGARTRFINEKEDKTIDAPEIDEDKIVTLDDVGTKRYLFPLIQSRIYRNTFTEFLSGDLPMYLYHLTTGYCKIINKVTSVYNFSGNGIFSELDKKIADKLYEPTFYRLIQYYGYKYEKIWFRMLNRKNQKKIKFLSCLIGRKLAWKVWFFLYMVPTFGKASLDKYWNYTSYTRKIKGINKTP